MKYFTPELYQRFNSLDVVEAERADAEWDQAEVAYKARLASIRDQMPSQIVKLSELCLHDSLVVSREEQTQSAGEAFIKESGPIPLWIATGVISVTMDQEVTSLIYFLSDHITQSKAPEDWRLSKFQEQWLYDEVDMINDRKGPFVHRILFSTGITWEIPFVSVIIHRFTVPVAKKLAKQSA